MGKGRFLAKVRPENLLIWIGLLLTLAMAAIVYQDYRIRKKVDKELKLAESIVQEVALGFDEAGLERDVRVTDEYLRRHSEYIDRIIITPSREVHLYLNSKIAPKERNLIVMVYASIDDLRRGRVQCNKGSIEARKRPFRCRV